MKQLPEEQETRLTEKLTDLLMEHCDGLKDFPAMLNWLEEWIKGWDCR